MPDDTNATDAEGEHDTPIALQPILPVQAIKPGEADYHEPEVADQERTFQGEPNGLPPRVPGVQTEPPAAVIALEEWFHHHIKNSVHSRDTEHYNELFRIKEALRLAIHRKYPLEA